MLLAQLEAATSSYDNYEAKKDLAKRERVWEPLGSGDLDSLLLHLTGKTEEQADIAKRKQQRKVATHQAATVNPGGNNNPHGCKGKPEGINVSNGKIDSGVQGGGNGSEYLLRRLAKKHPDVLEQYEDGAFKSVRQAAIAAGIVKVKTPAEQAIAALGKCDGKKERTIVLNWIKENWG